MRVYHKAAEFRGKSALSTWIYRIAVNVCVGQNPEATGSGGGGVRRRWTRTTSGRLRTRDRALVWAWTSGGGGRVRASIAGLNPDYRIVLVLRYFQDLSYDEITRVLGWTLPTVKVKLHRARRAFAARYSRLESR